MYYPVVSLGALNEVDQVVTNIVANGAKPVEVFSYTTPSGFEGNPDVTKYVIETSETTKGTTITRVYMTVVIHAELNRDGDDMTGFLVDQQ